MQWRPKNDPIIVCFEGLANLDIMQSLKRCDKIWNPSLFKSDVMGEVVQVFWNHALWYDQAKEMCLYFMLMATYQYAAKHVKSVLVVKITSILMLRSRIGP